MRRKRFVFHQKSFVASKVFRFYIRDGGRPMSMLVNVFPWVRYLCGVTATLIAFCTFCLPARGVTVFRDDFNRPNSSTLGAISGPGTGTWSEIPSPSSGADIVISDGAAVGIHGNTSWIYEALVPTAGFLAPWSSTLASNPGKVTWNINLQSTKPDMGGVALPNNGIGVYLAATGSGFQPGSVAYMLGWGMPGSGDPLQLARAGDNQPITPFLTASIAPFHDISTNYLSLRVEYIPTTNTWTLFARDDGASGFSDPATGGYVNLGSSVDATFTDRVMTHVGFYGTYTANTVSDLYRYDNFSITVAPEPSSVSLLATAPIFGLYYRARRGNRTLRTARIGTL
jgi:hypothetical protein